jgi:hypothetical protein
MLRGGSIKDARFVSSIHLHLAPRKLHAKLPSSEIPKGYCIALSFIALVPVFIR